MDSSLGDSRDRLRLALEAAGLGTFLIDCKTGIAHYSPELAMMLGFPEIKSSPLALALGRVHRDDEAWVREVMVRAMDPGGKGRLRIEFRYVRRGGEVRWMSWDGQVDFEETDGRPVASRIIGVCADTTERKDVEERLKESEARFRALVELASDWYWEQDEELRFTSVSEPVVQLAGSSPESHIGKTRWELPAVGGSEEQWTEHRKILDRREPFRNFEYRRLNDHGQVIWLSTSGDPIFDAAGRFRGYRGTGHNITARKEAEARLRESEARFRLFADSAPVLIWVTNPCGGTYFNRPHLEFVGAACEKELEGMAWTRHLHPDDSRVYLTAFVESEQRRAQFEAQARFRRADGAYRWMKSIGLPRFSETGEYLGYVGSTLDITDLKNHEERISFLVRELDHRVKNILARFEVVIERSADGSGTAPVFVEALRQRVEAMARAHELLSRARWSGAALQDVIRQQVDAFANRSNVHLSGPELIVNPDAAQAISIVVNELATNAAKYGALSVRAGQVHVVWSLAADEDGQMMLEICWSEQGGPKVCVPQHEGYGTKVIRDLLAHELDARVELVFAPSGLRCRMVMTHEEVRVKD